MTTTEKSELQQAGRWLSKGFRHLLIGLTISLFGALCDVLRNLWKDLSTSWKKKDWDSIIGIFFASLIIFYLAKGGAIDMYNAIERKVHSDWYKEQFLASYESVTYKFFKLYSQKFAQRDCDFMSKVGIDEANFDKNGRTQYEKYDCERFYHGIKAKYFLPFELDPTIESATKLRIRGKMVVLEITEENRYLVGAQYFEIWKVREGDMWRLNASSKEGSPKIPLEFMPKTN